jgi:hypothetical protein
MPETQPITREQLQEKYNTKRKELVWDNFFLSIMILSLGYDMGNFISGPETPSGKFVSILCASGVSAFTIFCGIDSLQTSRSMNMIEEKILQFEIENGVEIEEVRNSSVSDDAVLE